VFGKIIYKGKLSMLKSIFILALPLTLGAQQPLTGQQPPNDAVHSQQQQQQMVQVSPEKAMNEFKFIAKNIDLEAIRSLPVHHNGRLKPLDTLAREVIMYLNGSYSRNEVHPVQAYLALTRYENAGFVEILELRNTQIRQELGFLKEKRFYSLAELQNTQLGSLTEPIIKKQEQNAKSLTPHDKALLEVLQQASLLSDIISAQNLMTAADYTFLDNTHGAGGLPATNTAVQEAIKSYFQSMSSEPEIQKQSASTLINLVRSQKTPELFQHSLEKMETEVFFNKAQFFLWSSILSLIFGICFFVPLFKDKISFKVTVFLYTVPVVLLTIGLAFRIYITRFAPVTNMYTTMIWVAFGVMIFSLLLFILYKNYVVPGLTLIASGLILMLTYQIPLILSPDLDPIVAVLRNNFWLSTHVTTITISYAAFTIAMVLGNVALIRLWFYKDNEAFFKEYSHYAYRMIQLGCFLLTMGIILGGIWADYSWGRFWGWDPKETWALIADLGFLAILHARLVGWIKPFSLLAWSPVAYLLVIMAWYGVNFVLAAGLHSYGFSSGGATAMAIFVGLQIILLIAGFTRLQFMNKAKAS
jgi:ABC-type transport system involved in cytochrome c biogenesis permease subunit